MKLLLETNAVVKRAIDNAIGSGREVGVQVAAYYRGELVIVSRQRMSALLMRVEAVSFSHGLGR
jgi:hypothetical protein